ncbi:myosin-7-like [Pollicipes pollicipes]|uniref:myosin-7-like n=1 Tax=Pollicipes pollicipes TaxID=41117 RepID=UPI0018852187|nr:myosin-7-like [Pollicipes pollicipes]
MHQLTCNGVLEGIRICRKGFPNRMVYHDFRHRYVILAPKEMKEKKEDRDACDVCLKKIDLDSDKFRLGLTKVAWPLVPILMDLNRRPGFRPAAAGSGGSFQRICIFCR